MTDMSRRDLTPETMAHQAVHRGAGDAGLEPGAALAGHRGQRAGRPAVRPGRASGASPGCARPAWATCRWSTSTTRAPGAPPPCTSGCWPPGASRPVLVVGVEKMWTGDRAATIAGIEDGLPADYRADMHARFPRRQPAGSVLMGLNATGPVIMDERGTTVEQIAAAAVKARRYAARNPLAQFQQTDHRRGGPGRPPGGRGPDPPHVQLVHRRCGRRGAGRARGRRTPAGGAPYHRFRGSLGQRRASTTTSGSRRPPTAAWEAFGFGPEDVDVVELHDATSAEELYALESLGFFAPGEAGLATLAGDTDSAALGDRQPERRPGGPGPPAGRHRHGPGGRAGPPSCGAGPAPARWTGARLGRRRQHRRHHRGRRRLRRHPRPRGGSDLGARHHRQRAGASPSPTRS